MAGTVTLLASESIAVRGDEPDEVVPGAGHKVMVTLLWLSVSAIPSLIFFALDVHLHAAQGFESSWFLLPVLWCGCAGFTAPLYARMLGHTGEVRALPPRERALHHLPPGCAWLVEETATIRADLGDVEGALQRAWELANAVDHAPPEVRMVIENAGATLEPIRALLAVRAEAGRSRRSQRRLREGLETALARFEDALAHPRAAAFR